MSGLNQPLSFLLPYQSASVGDIFIAHSDITTDLDCGQMAWEHLFVANISTILPVIALTKTLVAEPQVSTPLIPNPTTGHDPEPVPFTSHLQNTRSVLMLSTYHFGFSSERFQHVSRKFLYGLPVSPHPSYTPSPS
jgi:hypothetical protein